MELVLRLTDDGLRLIEDEEGNESEPSELGVPVSTEELILDEGVLSAAALDEVLLALADTLLEGEEPALVEIERVVPSVEDEMLWDTELEASVSDAIVSELSASEVGVPNDEFVDPLFDDMGLDTSGDGVLALADKTPDDCVP